MRLHHGFSKWLLWFLVLIFMTGCAPAATEPLLSVHVLDVGQGDSIFIITPGGKVILIDGSEAEYGATIIDYLEDHRVSAIDYLIATHPHSDHIGGLPEVMDRFPVKHFIMPRVLHTTRTFERLLLAAEAQGLSITEARSGDSYDLEPGLELKILGPVQDYGDQLNNWSVVAQLIYNEKAFLFTGDAEATAEADLLAAFDPQQLRSHFLKVGHHGSNTSTSPSFLEAVQPDVAAISLGRNNAYGHPHQEILERLAELSLYRTDEQGTLVFYSDGREIWSYQPPFNQ